MHHRLLAALVTAIFTPHVYATTHPAFVFSTGPDLTLTINTVTQAEGIQHDFLLDFTGQYTGSQLLVELDTGSILGTTSPLPFGQPFSTFLALGDPNIGDGGPAPNIGGGAVDLGGTAAAVFSSTAINQAWNVPGGGTVNGATDFLSARLSLSPDANGTFSYLFSIDGELNVISGDIPIVPEPAAARLLCLAALALAARKRSRATLGNDG